MTRQAIIAAAEDSEFTDAVIASHAKSLLLLTRVLTNEFSSAELSETESQLKSLIVPGTDVANAVEALVASQASDHLHGSFLKYKFLLVLTRMLAKTIGMTLKVQAQKKSVNGHPDADTVSLLRWLWASSQDSYLAMFEHYSEYVFPEKQESLRKVLDLYAGAFMQALAGPHGVEILSGLVERLDKRQYGRFFLDHYQDTVRKAERTAIARTAGAAQRKANPQRVKAIEMFNARRWTSALQAAKTITPHVLSMDKNRLSEDRAEKTVHEWILTHQKEQKTASSNGG
ncbi:hypothetical protein [Caballeronia sp. INSB1]|uniref:hypothetical protein n=1 Tax=Caballeronia sp. INSB1 TaxID=2921751 RepID=UPI0020323811|nr:hypothetical protein [Caballeronia sp. INSB1]